MVVVASGLVWAARQWLQMYFALAVALVTTVTSTTWL